MFLLSFNHDQYMRAEHVLLLGTPITDGPTWRVDADMRMPKLAAQGLIHT